MVDKKTGLKPKAKNSKPKTEVTKTVKKDIEKIQPVAIKEASVEDVKTSEKVAARAGDSPTKLTAKSGKRSAKTVAKVEEKQAKVVRKSAKTDADTISKKLVAKPRSREERAGKKYQEAAKLIDKSKDYTPAEAVDLAIKTVYTKFDATIELHARLGVDPKIADQNVRSTVVLPAGSGKTVNVAVLAEGNDALAAKKAGADLVGTDEIFQQLDKEQIGFDTLIATPTMMAKLAKYAKLLGPRGLMPSPKSGTVATDTAKAVLEAKAGKVEYRVDQDGIVHLGFGKVSLGPEKLTQNLDAVLASIKAARPASLKGSYIKSLYVSSTMSPSIKLVAN